MRRLVSEARVARLATTTAEGRPHVVPIVFALDGNVLYSSVDEKPKGTTRLRRLENIERDPRVAVLVDYYEEDWTRLWWVRLDGRTEIFDEGRGSDRGVELLHEKYDQYRDAPPRGPVIAVRIESWRGWAWSSLESPA